MVKKTANSHFILCTKNAEVDAQRPILVNKKRFIHPQPTALQQPDYQP